MIVPGTQILCQLCRKLVRIISLTVPASFKSECVEANCPINADCKQDDDGSSATLFAYQISFV